jgi:1-acyl-sn-glycerol-3-phosphate acyltransferase
VTADYHGARPPHGMVVSNHLSYLDIVVYASAMPCVFVAKRDVRRWPIFGQLAGYGGTIFIDRQNRASTEKAAAAIGEALRGGVSVLLFPEGTSTDGSAVLRFHPSLLEPAVRQGTAITSAAIGYKLPGGKESDLCYYGNVRFVPHLLRTLGRTGVSAEVEFHPDREPYAERKGAALGLREKVEAMRMRMRRGRGAWYAPGGAGYSTTSPS